MSSNDARRIHVARVNIKPQDLKEEKEKEKGGKLKK